MLHNKKELHIYDLVIETTQYFKETAEDQESRGDQL